MKTKKSKLYKEMEKLRKILMLYYPVYHWKHSKVLTAYWNLRKQIEN